MCLLAHNWQNSACVHPAKPPTEPLELELTTINSLSCGIFCGCLTALHSLHDAPTPENFPNLIGHARAIPGNRTPVRMPPAVRLRSPPPKPQHQDTPGHSGQALPPV
jgi:hypothetical protein